MIWAAMAFRASARGSREKAEAAEVMGVGSDKGQCGLHPVGCFLCTKVDDFSNKVAIERDKMAGNDGQCPVFTHHRPTRQPQRPPGAWVKIPALPTTVITP
ncbi:hypothetical protein DLREEDagrD3_00160 [Denitratisoma sp. agr-D3]